MRGMLEDEQNRRNADYAKAIQEENKRLAREKREREEAWRREQEASNQAEVTLPDPRETLGPDGKTFKPNFEDYV